MYKGKIFDAEIVSVSEDGSGIAKCDGYTVFVKNAVLGDRCKIEITKANKSYGFGRMVSIEETSPHRVKPPCGAFPLCGGCTLLHTTYDCQLNIKRDVVKNALERIGGFKDIFVHKTQASEPCIGYRNKSQYPIGGSVGAVNIGFYAQKSHNVVDCRECLIDNPISSKIIAVLRKWMDKYAITPYDETNHSGTLRHIFIRSGEETQIVIVSRTDRVMNLEKLVQSLIDLQLDCPISSVILNINSEKTNTILGKKDRILFGKNYITCRIDDIVFNVGYRSFFQVNRYTTPILYRKALELCHLNGTETVFDLYCGIGTISLFLAKAAKKVIGVEIVPQAIEDAKKNAKLNNIENAEFYAGAAEKTAVDLINKGETADVVVLDPPRKGCDEKLLNAIGEMNPEKIVYVSCNVSTLARDAKILCDRYGYTMNEAFPFDQFPHSMHVETVVLMSKVR